MSASAEGGSAPGTAPEDRARADVYALLGALLAGPPDENVLRIVSGIAPQGDLTQGMSRAWHRLSQAAGIAQPRELEGEYYALFIGLGRGELVPYASSYLTGFLMEKPLADLRSALSRLGFSRQEGVKEPEDHAAALCEVMALIIRDRGIDFRGETVFFEQFVAPWMGRFFEDLEKAEAARFYRAVAVLGREFIAVEERFFSMPA